MECEFAKQQILEALDEPLPAGSSAELNAHCVACEDCRNFQAAQLQLDAVLSSAIVPPQLSPEFRGSLRKRIEQQQAVEWPEFLPDLAHIAGCGFATLVCLSVLPFPATQVIPACLAFTLATYFLQSLLQDSSRPSMDE